MLDDFVIFVVGSVGPGLVGEEEVPLDQTILILHQNIKRLLIIFIDFKLKYFKVTNSIANEPAQ